MSETALVESVAASQITWDAATFGWKSNDGNKSWSGASTFNYSVKVSSSISIAESSSLAFIKTVAEAWSLTDRLQFMISLNVIQSMAFSETWSDVANFMLRVCENLGVTESLGLKLGRTFQEAFGVSELAARNVSKSFQDAMTIAEFLTKAQTIGIQEGISILETEGLSFQKLASEGFSTSELASKNIGKNAIESISMLEAFGRVASFNLSLREGLNIAEAASRAIGLNANEALMMVEEYRRRGNAVISDISLLTDEITSFAFQNIVDSGHSPGYASFKDFIPADYDYQKAIFRVIMESSTSDRAKLNGLSVGVDVPDVIDSGSATITIAANGIRVNFARRFHIPPEVTLTMKGGTVMAIPSVQGSVDKTGFTGVLRTVDGTLVTGSFTWAAQGY